MHEVFAKAQHIQNITIYNSEKSTSIKISTAIPVEKEMTFIKILRKDNQIQDITFYFQKALEEQELQQATHIIKNLIETVFPFSGTIGVDNTHEILKTNTSTAIKLPPIKLEKDETIEFALYSEGTVFMFPVKFDKYAFINAYPHNRTVEMIVGIVAWVFLVLVWFGILFSMHKRRLEASSNN